MSSKNKKKYGSFANFILEDKDVFKWLYMFGQIVPFCLFFIIFVLLIITQKYSISALIGIFTVASGYRVYKFFKWGGVKNMPEFTSKEFVWGGKNEEKQK